MMLAVDTETTGLDFFHGSAKPFFVTTCDEEGNQTYFEWDVDPLTRDVKVPHNDRTSIQMMITRARHWGLVNDEEMRERHVLVLQNPKFDVRALESIGIGDWPWSMTRDTLMGGHLLASNQPHNLTDMGILYIGEDITPYEEALKQACHEARRLARSKFKDWRIAKEGLPDMPSVKGGKDKAKKGVENESPWKNDSWLPRRIAQELGYADDHPWWTVLRDYSNADSAMTMLLWKEMRKQIVERGLWEIYLERLKGLKVGADMETRGVTCNGTHLDELEEEFRETSQEKGAILVNIAAGDGWALKLPKSGNNKCLTEYIFEGLKCPVLDYTDKGNPCLDKNVMEEYSFTLPAKSKQAAFIKALRLKRKYDTALSYMEGYRRFWIPIGDEYASSCKQSVPDGNKSSPTVSSKSGEESRLLDLEGLTPRQRLRAIPSIGRKSSTPSQLHSIQRGDPLQETGSSHLRQSPLCESSPSLFGDTFNQHEGYDRERERSQSERRGTPRSDDNRGRRKTHQGVSRSEEVHPSRSLSSFQLECPANVGDRTQKVLETYLDFYRLHPSLNPTGTATLRWSSSSPNEQNISKKEEANIRYCFGPAPGREWWSLDAKNIELRIPAYEADEKDLIALFEDPGPPFYGSEHLLNFSIVYQDIWERELKEVGIDKVGPHCKSKYKASHYQDCKNGDFAIGYGCQKAKADSTFKRVGAFELLKSKFAKKEHLNQRMIANANKYGYVETIPDKTVNPHRGYPVMCSRTNYGKIKPTVPLNYHVQSSAMWWTMKAMILCDAQLADWRKKGWDGFLTMQVHDECVFDLPRAADPKKDPKRSNLGRVKQLAALMARGGSDWVIPIPTPVGIEYHSDNWRDGVVLA